VKNIIVPYFETPLDYANGIEINDFTYPWKEDSPPSTIFHVYHDKKFLHFRFTAFGPPPLVYIKDNHKLEVIHSERIEIFFKQDDELNPYYCFEIDPHGRVLDYQAHHYRDFNRDWKWSDDLNIKTEILADRYLVSGQFKLSILSGLGLFKGDKLQVGLYRGHCTSLVGTDMNIQWISWVDPQTEEPDFHVPSSFGRFELEDPTNLYSP